jgi:EAL domain-containing protein (putative c-di-GMP-specific phosphodiesterase class I)
VAEEVGLMRELGLWVFEAAARQAAAWNAKGLDKFTVAVNVSLSQLRDPEFVAHVEAILARTACAPAWLSLEIDEKTAVKDLETVNQNLGALRALGLTVAIDDFGTGATSLSHLRQLPVGTLKIDRSFMAEIGDDPGDAASREGRTIVAAVTGLATGLGLEVVAQGVERPSQLQLVRELGCQAYQGFLACPPVKAAELESWHAARQ